MAVGIKDSSGDPDMLEERYKAFPDKEVFAGTDGMTLICLRAGAAASCPVQAISFRIS